MNPLEEFGEQLAPPSAEPPAALRHRVVSQGRRAKARTRATANSLHKGKQRVPTVLRGRRWAGAVAAMAVALIAILLPPALGGTFAVLGPDTGTDRAQTAGQVLELAAQRVAVAPALAARPDQFVYLESVAVYQQVHVDGWSITTTAPIQVREWRSVDGTADSVTEQRPVATAGADWTSTRVPGCRNGFLAGTHTSCRPEPAYDSSLPTDGAAMYAYLYRAGDDDLPVGFAAQLGPDQRAVERAAYVLYLGQTSPPVQSAVFAALGRVPGVTVQTGVSDVAGRPGVGLVTHGTVGVTELIFDPHTYRYLGMSRTLPQLVRVDRDQGPTIQLVTEQAVQQVAIVDHTGIVP